MIKNYSAIIRTPIVHSSKCLLIRKQFRINCILENDVYRVSYMSDHALLNLLYELRKSDKKRGLPYILSLFYKFNNTRARMLDFIYHMV